MARSVRSSVCTLTLLALSAAACSDSSTTPEPTSLNPGDRFAEVFPDQVNDLSVRVLNHRAVELEWTEVDDGKGLPAQYQVRLATGAQSWGDASVVREGPCGYPVRGVRVGLKVNCIVSGLEASRTYTLLVGAERAELTGTVTGPPSVTASATTRDEPLIAVPAEAEIVSGLSQSGTVGQALQTEVKLLVKDSIGAPMPNVFVMWASGAGGGTTASPVSVSDEYGYARTVWTLGPQAGPQTLGVRVAGHEELVVAADAAPGPVDQLRFSVDTLELELGEEHRPVVRGWDEYGNAIEDLELEWQTSNQSVVSVDSRGVLKVNGRGWGWIRAWIRDRLRKTKTTDSTTVVVEADPANLSGVSVAGSGQDWLNIQFTEVEDGTGRPADYATRLGSPGTSWADATEIAEGPCESPIRGSAVGAQRSCTVSGLEADTDYVLFVRPLREKRGERIYASLASSVSGTTQPAPQVPAGLAAEQGVNQVGQVGAPLPSPIVVRVLDTQGAPISGAQITFAPSDGGSVSSTSALTDDGGRAQVTWTLGSKAGTQSLMTAIAAPSGAPGAGAFVAQASTTPIPIPATANPGATTTLTVTPTSLSMQEGQSRSLSVQAADAFGNPTSTAGVTFTSDDSSIASVTGSGGVGAVGAGSTVVRAQLAGVEATVTVDVQSTAPPPSSDPTQISDVRVVSTTETSVTLEFTEVDDGTGSPATSEIRYAFSPMGWGWGSATVLQAGACGSPMAGGTIGATRVCVVDGLQPGTAYDFQMVAWRADAGNNVYSPLSNITTGTTVSTSTPQVPQVASIEVTPKQVTFDQVGQSQELFALAYDASGNIVNTPISWTSSDPSVATVTASGSVTARAAGTVLITAAAVCCGQSDASTITVASVQQPPPPPPSSGNAWYTQDWSFGSAGQMFGDQHISDATTGGGNVSLLSNAGGPGFSRALRVEFKANGGGEAQAGVDLFFPNAGQDRPREIWFEYYARFSSNWEVVGPYGGSAGHKHLFLFDQAQTGAGRWEHITGLFGDLMSMQIAGNLGPGGQQKQFQPGIRSLWDGNWHQFRCHARMDSSNGTWECEIDGQTFTWGTGDTDRGSQYYFNQMSLSRNLNKGTDRDMTLDFGPVQVYTSNPGW